MATFLHTTRCQTSQFWMGGGRDAGKRHFQWVVGCSAENFGRNLRAKEGKVMGIVQRLGVGMRGNGASWLGEMLVITG